MVIPADDQRHQGDRHTHKYHYRYRKYRIYRLVPAESQCCQYHDAQLTYRKHPQCRPQETSYEYHRQKLYKKDEDHFLYRITGGLHDGGVLHISHDKVLDAEMRDHQCYRKNDGRKQQYDSYKYHGKYHGRCP